MIDNKVLKELVADPNISLEVAALVDVLNEKSIQYSYTKDKNAKKEVEREFQGACKVINGMCQIASLDPFFMDTGDVKQDIRSYMWSRLKRKGVKGA